MVMAGMTSSFRFRFRFHLAPLPPRLFNKTISSFSSSLAPRFLGLHVSRSGSNSSPTPRCFKVTARYGSQSDLDDDDQALDLSSIRSNSVRLIDQKQNMVGVVSKSEAIQMAEAAELDLVILSTDADPPVVRIMDFNKYRYEQQKKKKVQQKKSLSTRMELKELKMGYNIDQHDYSVRLKAAKKFIKDGDKVKVMVNLKGRENDFRNIAIELLRRFQNDVGELASEESKKFSDRNMFIVLVPNKAVLQKAQEGGKKKDNEVSASV